LAAPRGRPRWAARGVGKFLRRSHAAQALEDSPNQTKRLKRRELQGKNIANIHLSEGLLKLQRLEGKALTQDTARTPRHGCHQGGPPVQLDRGW
jgi:hypothetical protein